MPARPSNIMGRKATNSPLLRKPWLKRIFEPSCDRLIPLAANGSTIFRCRSVPYNGEHSGQQCEHDPSPIVSQFEQEPTLFTGTNCDDCERLQIALIYRDRRMPRQSSCQWTMAWMPASRAVYRPVNIGRASIYDVDWFDRHAVCP